MTPLAYGALVLFLRLSGKRTLAKLNIFDFVVTVALGSTLATVILSKDVAFVEGALALSGLVGLQYLVAVLSRRSHTVRRLVKSGPQAILVNGEIIHEALQRERLTVPEVYQALRREGIGELDDVAAVVLETDGTMSVIVDAQADSRAMSDVAGWNTGDRSDRAADR